MAKGNATAIIVIGVVIALILAIVLLRGIYSRSASDYGIWSDYQTTICSNDGQACTVQGTSQRYRTCTPNAKTGYGCIDSNGTHTYKPEITEVPCTPVCQSSVFTPLSEVPCSIYDDSAGTMLAGSQVCRNPDQFAFTKIERQCVAKDSTGTNACVKSDGTLASVGDVETVLIPCTTVPDCFQGTWLACPNPPGFTSGNCGAAAADCGRVVMSTTDAVCQQIIGGVPTIVASSECYPPDDPGPCDVNCFNFPCDTYPAGFSNIASFQNGFLEIFNTISSKYIVADFTVAQAAAASSQQDVLASLGDVDTKLDSSGDRVRFIIIPSQANVPDGYFYLGAILPLNGQSGIANWDGSNLVISTLPGLASGETFDDLVTPPDLFTFTGASAPYRLQKVDLPGPTLTDLYCGAMACIDADVCDAPTGGSCI